MPSQTFRVQFPSKGIIENFAFTDQPPTTSVDLQNVRSYDPGTGRSRGGQRSGLEKYNDNQIGAGGVIQDIVHVVYGIR